MSKFSCALLCTAAGLLVCLSIGVHAADKPTTRGSKPSAKKGDVAESTAPKPISTLMIWNGEDFKGGHSWASKGTTFAPTSDVSHSGKTCLQFDGSGANFVGGGFNFFGWYPPDSGVDISNYDNLSMWVRVDCPPKKGPGTLGIMLNCSATKKQSEEAKLEDYCPDILDGRWHEVVIPLKHIFNHEFDPASVWELDVSTWQPDHRHFTVYIDDVSVDIRPAQ